MSNKGGDEERNRKSQAQWLDISVGQSPECCSLVRDFQIKLLLFHFNFTFLPFYSCQCELSISWEIFMNFMVGRGQNNWKLDKISWKLIQRNLCGLGKNAGKRLFCVKQFPQCRYLDFTINKRWWWFKHSTLWNSYFQKNWNLSNKFDFNL